ncbi:hypothetical protein ACHAWF_008529 [Thalassiosira exigua]
MKHIMMLPNVFSCPPSQLEFEIQPWVKLGEGGPEAMNLVPVATSIVIPRASLAACSVVDVAMIAKPSSSSSASKPFLHSRKLAISTKFGPPHFGSSIVVLVPREARRRCERSGFRPNSLSMRQGNHPFVATTSRTPDEAGSDRGDGRHGFAELGRTSNASLALLLDDDEGEPTLVAVFGLLRRGDSEGGSGMDMRLPLLARLSPPISSLAPILLAPRVQGRVGG